MVQIAVRVLSVKLEDNLHSKNLLDECTQELTIACDSTWMTCQDHGELIISLIFRRMITTIIRSQCKMMISGVLEAESRCRSARKIGQQTTGAR